MKICPRCEAGYPDELTTCPVHGGLLSEIRELKPGMLVRGTYRIVRKLSQGGMGQVYLAEHILLKEPQVLKFISRDLSRDEKWSERFLREVRTLRQIRHKNVVQAGNLEPAEDGTLFFSMEYVDGPDLHEFARHAPKPFDVALALTLTRGIAEGLGAAHAVGVVHRDIKPENILIASDGNTLSPKIADFGIVATKEAGRLTQSGTTMLTPQFAAPEQWLGKPTADLDGRTDLYALGGMLFELLTGQCAFQADNYQAWAMQHIHAPAPAPSNFRAILRNWHGLDGFVLKLLEKNPADRPQNIREVLRMMNRIDYVPPVREVVPLEVHQAARPPAPAVKAPPAQPPAREHPAEIVEAPAPPENPVSAAHPAAASLNGDAASAIQKTDAAPPAAVAIAVDAAETPLPQQPQEPSSEPDLSRPRVSTEPMPIWEPFQPRQPSGRSRANIRHPEPVSGEDGGSQKWRTALAAAVVLLAVGVGIRTIAMNVEQPRILSGQKGTVFALAFSPNGLYLASDSRDGTVQFWGVADGRPLGELVGNSTCLAYSPLGDTVATGMADNTIDLWDSTRDVVLATLQGHTAPVAAVAFSRDGNTLASASWDKTVRIWDVASGRVLQSLTGSNDRVLSVAYSPDGGTLASAGADAIIRIWYPSTGALLRIIPGHTGAIESVTFSPDGRTLASAGDDATIRLWNWSTGQQLRLIQSQSGAVHSVSFSPDGRWLASAGANGEVMVWDTRTGRLVRALRGVGGPVLSIAFSPFGPLLAAAGSDKTIRLWSTSSFGQ